MLPILLRALFAAAALAELDPRQSTAFPVSQLFTLTLRDVWIPSQWSSANSSNIVEFRPLIPFEVGDQLNVMRLTVPYRTHSRAGSGLGDVRLFGIFAFRKKRGFWGVGPALNLRANLPQGTDTIQAGFVFGFVTSIGRWNLGVLNQNLFSDRVAVSTVQPVASYRLSDQWTLGLGEVPFVFDWKSLTRTFVPIGFQLGFQTTSPRQPVRFFVNPQFNTKNLQGAPRWTVVTGLTLVVHLPRPL